MEATKEKKKILTQEDIMKLLNALYEKSLDGIPKISPSVEEFAAEYIAKYPTKESACKAMIKNQVAKCTTSGVVTGFGGLITLPVSVPANVSTVLYMQIRMIACAAYMAGFDVGSDATQTFVYACLAGVAIDNILKNFGVKFGEKMAVELIKKIPGKVCVAINQKVGFRLLTKFGEKGLINLGKMVPVVGAIISGGLDLAETKIIGDRAYNWFFHGDFSSDDNAEEAVIIDIEEE